MPSACTKPENKASTEAPNSVEKCIVIVEKKVRNLEKRKGKLDGYRAKRKGGETLNEDQEEAVSKYDVVLQNLEFARDLQKQFQSISGEIEKLLKKKAKREKAEKQEQEMGRLRELLNLQDLLSNMGTEEVRDDFKNGTHGAVALSEDNLEQLDELYKLITPSREGEKSYAEQLTHASEHIVNLLEGRDKEVAGTTYKLLKELADKIHECGYFENLTKQEAEPEPEPAPVVEEVPVIEEPAPVELPETTAPVVPEEPIPVIEPVPVVTREPEQRQPIPHPTQAAPPSPTSVPVPDPAAGFEDDSFFTTPQYTSNQPRGFQEIVSSVQGNYNFLQDSEIDVESLQRVDPAVVAAVAAHPMASGISRTHPPQDKALAQSGYPGSSLMSNEDQTASAASTYSQQVAAQSDRVSHHAAAQPSNPPGSHSQHIAPEALDYGAAATSSLGDNLQQPPSQTQLQFGAVDALDTQSTAQQQATGLDSGYDQSYGQTLMSQTLGGSTSSQHVSSYGDQSASGMMQSHMGLPDQSVDNMGSASSSGGPQPIPLPNQPLSGQSLRTQTYSATEGETAATSQQEKKYTMNPNADPFKSTAMFNQDMSSTVQQPTSSGASTGVMGSQEQSQAPTARKSAWGPAPTAPTAQPSTQQASSQPEEQTSQETQEDYQNYNHYGGNRGNRGGNRGGYRGNNRGMNNSYQRGGNRGGNSYGGNRGGGYSNGRGGGGGRGGGSTWQGYPPRTDYRPDGYQGTGMRGGPRGGSGGSRGGGRGGGFGRPNNQQNYPQQ